MSLSADNPWYAALDGDDRARGLYHRHYSRRRYADGRRPRLFVGPGSKLVLLTPDARALFVWRRFISADDQEGVNCAVFRTEYGGDGPLASQLIGWAEEHARLRWPAERRAYTYVDPARVRSSNPGYCFLAAGWRRLPKRTKSRRLMVFERDLSTLKLT